MKNYFTAKRAILDGAKTYISFSCSFGDFGCYMITAEGQPSQYIPFDTVVCDCEKFDKIIRRQESKDFRLSLRERFLIANSIENQD